MRIPLMLRLAGFFVATLVVLHFLRQVPVIGQVFDIPILGFWGAAILVSAAASKLADAALRRRRLSHRLRDLGHVETPHNQGKLGTLLAVLIAPTWIQPLVIVIAVLSIVSIVDYTLALERDRRASGS